MDEPPKTQADQARKLPRAMGDVSILRQAVEQMKERQSSRKATLLEKLRASPVPLPPELFEEVANVSGLELDAVMSVHPGRKIWERHSSYLVSARVFDRSFADLLSAIGRFEAAVNNDIFNRSNEGELEDIESDVQKELFAATSAAHSLVDHSRRIKSVAELSDHDAKRIECFGDDSLHDFVIALRTLLHHLHAVKAGWNLRNDFEHGETAGFMLWRKDIEAALSQSDTSFTANQRSRIDAYVKAAPEHIDLKSIFEEYRRRSQSFRVWFDQVLSGADLSALRDYERCLKENKKRSIRMYWNALIGNFLNWNKPIRLYDHLPRYLSPDQLNEIYAMPLRSSEQIDRIIEIVDREGACDDSLRARVHRLFECAPPPES